MYTFFKSKNILVRYSISLFAEPRTGIELVSDFNSVEIFMKDNNTSANKDYLLNETKEFIYFFKPAPNAVANDIMSMVFFDGNPIKLTHKHTTSTLEGMVFRTDGNNHLSLGVVTSINTEIYIPPRLLSIAPSALELIYDESTRKVDFDKITASVILSNKWPFSSSTDAIVYEDSSGFLLMKGTIEFIIAPAIGGIKGSSFEITELMRSEGGGYLNLGKGAKIKIQNLSKPIELMDNNGTLHQKKNGNFIFSGEKWQEIKE